MIPTLTNAPKILFWRMRRFAQSGGYARNIIELSEQLQKYDAAALRTMTSKLRWRAATGAVNRELIPEAFALVREVARRFVGQSHYPEQLEAGIALVAGGVAEMQTGEGKTLTALLPAFLCSLHGRGCHVVTANDYLARRDAQFAAQVLSPLGVRVGCVSGDVEREFRKAEYDCDITYGTSREFGFDFLRDRLEMSECVQRGHYFALVDEADSVLLDDAATPLLIASAHQDRQSDAEMLPWFHDLAAELVPEFEFVLNHPSRMVQLTSAGCQRIQSLPKPTVCDDLDAEGLFERATDALAARLTLKRDRDYIIDNQQRVAIVDHSTGRVADGRKWRDGLQQAIEVKEGLEPSPVTAIVARSTV
ncbi:MAG: DEAD/DEAH box helicase, partial [Aeoliella sp.]